MKKIFLSIIILMTMTNSCQNDKQVVCKSSITDKWDKTLSEKMPYLGHRNWIVITDMAYPLQSGSGIETLYADESYEIVLEKVKKMIDSAPHVFAHIYRDKELTFIPEKDAPGIDELKIKMDKICGSESVSIPHEELIARLDSAGKLFNVVIIKTPLTIPYTTTFFELDCNYWDAARQKRLDENMAELGSGSYTLKSE